MDTPPMLKGWGGCCRARLSSGCCSSRDSCLSSSPPWASSILERGLEHTLVFVLCEPCAFGESIPESLGESSFLVLNGHFCSLELVPSSPWDLAPVSLNLDISLFLFPPTWDKAGEVSAFSRTDPTPWIFKSFTESLLKGSEFPRDSLLETEPIGDLLRSSILKEWLVAGLSDDCGLLDPVESWSMLLSSQSLSYMTWEWLDWGEVAAWTSSLVALAWCRNFSVWSVLRVLRSWMMVRSSENMVVFCGCWGTRIFWRTFFSLLCIFPTSSGFRKPGRSNQNTKLKSIEI